MAVDDKELAVIKALTGGRLNLEEAEILFDMEVRDLMVENELDYVQAEKVKSWVDNTKGKLPKSATMTHAKDENKKVCLKFNLNSFSRFAKINSTPIKIVTNEAEIKLWLPSSKITWRA